MKKRALLIGGFHKAHALADSLIKKGYRVTVINNDYQNCLILAENDSLTVINGGGLGSTAGGIKLSRVYLLLRITRENIHKRLSPARDVTAPHYYRAQGKTPIDNGLASNIVGFISCYLGIYIVGTLLFALTADCSLTEAMFEFASALGTVGLSIGLTGPSTGMATLVVEIIGMILGRLEIFIVWIGIYSGVSAIKQHFQKILN